MVSYDLLAVLKKMILGFSVISSIFSNSYTRFLMATLASAEQLLGYHLQPSEIISSAMLWPIAPLLSQQELSRMLSGNLSLI
ncbi:MAG: hypothetical protein P8M25_15425 [Paracoccaceae bacterium]|nr:hypothetical protein [Paracoccaceae bacterium]